MKIAITCDSVCDLSKEQLLENNIKILPLTINLGDDSYQDGININPDKIFEYVATTKQLPKTSANNEFQYTEFFEELLKENDAVIHFTLGSDISACYNNAAKASKNFENVKVIDSKNLSTGVGLLVLYACKLRDDGKSFEEIVQKVTARVPHVQASFVVERLDYLHKGGRCSAVALLGANILKIRPSIMVENGKMGVHKKYRGKMESVIAEYVKDTLTEFKNYDNTMCFLTYTSATPEMIAAAKKAISENAAFKAVYETTAGSTVTSHCGEHTLGILYFNDSEQH